MKKTILLFLFLFSFFTEAARLKDIANLRGVRSNHLVGYGLIVGLPGTGDKKNELTESSLGQLIKGIGTDFKAQKLDTKNTAIVVVNATLPPFVKVGTTLDATVSSIASASSLEGGNLMMTSLKGADGKIYAMAQGKIVGLKKLGGAAGGANASGSSNVLAIVPGGVMIEREVSIDMANDKLLHYFLQSPDFTTAVRVSRKINDEFGGKYATAVDASTVDVIFPYQYQGNISELIAQIESIEVETDRKAKIVINPRTGTVVMGESVTISPVAMAHSNLKVEVKEAPAAAPAADPSKQAAAGGGGGGSSKGRRVIINRGTTIAEIVANLNEMGASPDDMVALIRAIQASGALMAELEIQ